jgi:hypothetical protein
VIQAGKIFNPSVVVNVAGVTVPNLNGEGLRIDFSVSRTLDQSPDRATCTVYNLARETRAAMQAVFGETGRARLVINAGYDGLTSIIFAGSIRSMDPSRQVGEEVLTTVTADDAGDALERVNVTLYGIDINVRQMVKVALAKLNAVGYPITEHTSVQQVIGLADPFLVNTGWSTAHSGSVADLLDEAARIIGARWFIRSDQLYFSARNLPLDALPTVIPPEYRLADISRDGLGLARLPIFFEARVEPGSPVVVDGISYRVEGTTLSGDTNSGPWENYMVMREML